MITVIRKAKTSMIKRSNIKANLAIAVQGSKSLDGFIEERQANGEQVTDEMHRQSSLYAKRVTKFNKYLALPAFVFYIKSTFGKIDVI